MAGIFGLRAEDMDQVDALQRARVDWPNGAPMVRPHVKAPVLVRGATGMEASAARFGFSRRFSSFNARIEKVETTPLWRGMFGKSHCIVPVSYIVEWVEDGGGRRPYLIQRADAKPILAPALLGKYHEDRSQSAFAICTREPSRFFAHFHDRMVGMCTPELAERWLDPGAHDAKALLGCVRAPADDELVAVPTSPMIQKRVAGDWSALPAAGRPITWKDVQAGTARPQRRLPDA